MSETTVSYFKCEWPITIRTKAGRKKVHPDRDKLVRTEDPEVAGALRRAMGVQELSQRHVEEIEARRQMGTRSQPDDVPTSAELAGRAPAPRSMPKESGRKFPTVEEIRAAGYAFPELLLAALKEGRSPTGKEVAKVGEEDDVPASETETTSPGSTEVTGAEVGDVLDEEPTEGDTNAENPEGEPEKPAETSAEEPKSDEEVTAQDIEQMTKAELRGLLVELKADMPASDAKVAELREAALVAIGSEVEAAPEQPEPKAEAETQPAEAGGE